jgi:hypothetical protein
MKDFEVSLDERNKQRQEALEAQHLPALGYKRYRVYKEPPVKTEGYKQLKVLKNRSYGVPKGQLNVVTSGCNLGKSNMIAYYQYILNDFLAATERSRPKQPEFYDVKWLRPKDATLLRMQGERVEEHGTLH